MARCKGTVTGCGKGKFSFFITLDSKDGFYFNTKYEPKCGIGDVVGIEYEPKGDKRGNVQKVQILEDSGSPKGVQSRESSGGSGSNSGGSYTASPDRQASIIFQSSRKDALVFLGLLIEKEAVKFKGKADSLRVQITETLDEITAAFYKDAAAPDKSNALTTAAELADDSPGEEESGKKGEWANQGSWDDNDSKKSDDWGSGDWDD